MRRDVDLGHATSAEQSLDAVGVAYDLAGESGMAGPSLYHGWDRSGEPCSGSYGGKRNEERQTGGGTMELD